jgi:hypothetical protein
MVAIDLVEIDLVEIVCMETANLANGQSAFMVCLRPNWFSW